MLKCPRCDSDEIFTHEYDDEESSDDKYTYCTACELSFTTDSEGAITDFGSDDADMDGKIAEEYRK